MLALPFRTPRFGAPWLVFAFCACCLFGQPGERWLPSASATEPGLELFEKRIRPLFVSRCYECHGADKQQGGLRLDSREGWQRGGDSGPAIVPGQPDESLLLEAVRYESYEMPPDGKLSDEEIAAIERWISLGAPDPRTAAPAGAPADAARRPSPADHWAYQPLRRVAVPDVADADWPLRDVDRFILQALEDQGLRPVADASRDDWLRRVHFDLVGLPPSPTELAAFRVDDRPDAYQRVVDRLLASPHFGERWGRHWLDVARFAESVTLRGLIFREAWRYRDWVIGALNADVPYNRFVELQIAGDLLPADTWQQQAEQMVATTFLMLGNTNLEEQDKRKLDMDVVDEQLDTLGKALLAQTIGCARCHDHKFDPIPTRDYYALAGILASTVPLEHANVSKWVERPLPVAPALERQLGAHEQTLADVERQLQALRQRHSQLADATGPAVVAPEDLPGIVVDSAAARAVGDWTLSQYSRRYIGDGYLHDRDELKGAKTLTFHVELPSAGVYEVRFAYTPGGNRAANVPITVLHADGESQIEIDQRRRPPIEGRFVSLGRFRFERGNQGYVLVSNEGTRGHVIADAVQWLPIEAEDSSANGAAAVDGEATKPPQAAEVDAELAELQRSIQRFEKRLARLKRDGPRRPLAMVPRERPEPRDLPIHIRGSVQHLGEVVPRGFPSFAPADPDLHVPPDQSGRLQLARWLTSPTNPLTPRVIVNRVWHWLFGSSLVRTVDNFGTTGEAPSHPELLDHLTARFIEHGWSLKWLVRELTLSRTYRLAVAQNPDAAAQDPQNRLRWRMDRKRLEAEAIRDAILSISGQLERQMGGRTFPADLKADYGFVAPAPRRSVYVPVFRNALPELFEAFDFPDPSIPTGRRNTSTVAPQALYLLNHPFVIEQSRLAAQRLLAETPDNAARLDQLYLWAVARPASPQEHRLVAGYLAEQDANDAATRVAVWADIVQAVFASPEFRYLE